MSEPSTSERRERPLPRGLELATAVLLSAATVAAAWSGYQTARWGGVQATDFSTANASRPTRVSNASK